MGQDTNRKNTHSILKNILGVNRSTTNLLTRSELGGHSPQELILIRNINYIKYVEAKDAHSLVKQAATYEISYLEDRNSFYSLLKKYGRNMLNHNIRAESKSKLRKLIRDEFNTLWKTQVSSFPKAATYREFKNRVKFESYLSDIKNRNYRVTFTKFRLSDQ